jgi:hypothetical protein
MRKFFLAAVVAVAALFGSASSAEATFSLRITTTVGVTTITDGGPGDTDGLVNNKISFNYSDSAYNVIGFMAFTNAPGSANLAILDTSFTFATFDPSTSTNTTGGAASLEVSATGYNSPVGNPLTLLSKINGNGNGSGTLTDQGYITTNGALFDTSGATPGLQGPFNINSGYGNSATTSYTGGTPFTLTDVINVNLDPGSNTSGDAQLTVTTPAPAGLVLALVGMPVFGVGAYIRRRRAVAA